jgi:hypothetical protein
LITARVSSRKTSLDADGPAKEILSGIAQFRLLCSFGVLSGRILPNRLSSGQRALTGASLRATSGVVTLAAGGLFANLLPHVGSKQRVNERLEPESVRFDTI